MENTFLFHFRFTFHCFVLGSRIRFFDKVQFPVSHLSGFQVVLENLDAIQCHWNKSHKLYDKDHLSGLKTAAGILLSNLLYAKETQIVKCTEGYYFSLNIFHFYCQALSH